MTEKRTEEEGRDDPELQNEYNLTVLKMFLNFLVDD
jgi:hypothetical protein